MVKIWYQELSEDRDYNPNFPINRVLGFEWRQYLFASGSIPSCELSKGKIVKYSNPKIL
jgi:hypothetical protein